VIDARRSAAGASGNRPHRLKGAWLALWLSDWGATVTGYSLPPLTTPNCSTRLGIRARSSARRGRTSVIAIHLGGC